MTTISATTIRTALVDYRAELMRMGWKYPEQFKDNDRLVKEIDSVLLSIDGNVTTVAVTPNTCNPNV